MFHLLQTNAKSRLCATKPPDALQIYRQELSDSYNLLANALRYPKGALYELHYTVVLSENKSYKFFSFSMGR